ncbi:methanogenesis marker 6 protein [Methanolobus sp. ZRKC3]|uniref:methanogenesis marker 6 protein n=1 Tax=Methanolobus sp. ZRKC3 TaxID=3125786 RepID=UPI00324E0455
MPDNEDDVITKLVVLGSDSVLPIDAALKIYESETGIVIKETCFGTMVTGPRSAVNKVVKEVVALDKNHIFVKERGFPPGDDRRCRASRGGGARPGYYFMQEEAGMLPIIGKALDNYDKNVSLKEVKHKKKMDVDQLKDIIESTL